ncbi:Mu transposase C-terminal domain-containing protein [Paenibacillus periandrae]|uniref:Mu transposase C-terminal domain-containing protein n=1 Tax=Paenibacillus periandrae TaxID=1761741 RepID=UPI001F09158C|nr:Mu transposase C-terminal domain-containing protein [Paenibacillus periandrae]
MQFVSINQVVQWAPFEADNSVFERILYLEHKTDRMHVIDLNKDDFSFERSIEDVTKALTNGEARIVKYISEVEKKSYDLLPDERKREIDESWNYLKEYLENEPYIFMSEYRGPMVTELKAKSLYSIPKLHRLLKRYWKSGKLKIGLLNRYDNCGGPGSDKLATETTKKRGRKRKITKLEPEKVGVNTDATIHKDMLIAYKQFHLREKLSLRKAFKKMLRTYYISHYEENNGQTKPILLPEEERPLFKTFYYHVNKFKNANFIGTSLALIGDRRHNLDKRAKIGNQTKQALIPGSIFHIDSTIADTYLASSYRSYLPIGRPVIYSVIDLFSHYIAGIYIGFERSYIGAAMAIYNTGSSKVDLCQRSGMIIMPEEWSLACLPRQFTADRGELLNTKITGLRNILGVDIEYMAPYRADWKALVESFFNVYNVEAISRLPGEVSIEMRRRGDPDPRTKAVLTLKEFSQIMYDLAIWHNNIHYMEGYSLDDDMIADGVKPIPRELLEWGMKRKGHCFRSFDEETLKINLLPTETGRITNLGIKFKGLHFSCEQAIREGWFVDGNPRIGKKLNIAYDPRVRDKVVLKGDNGDGYLELRMINSDPSTLDKSWDEYQHIQEVLGLEREQYRPIEEQAEAEKDYRRDIIVEMAKALKPESGLSNAKLIDGIAERTALEKEIMRLTENFLSDDNSELQEVQRNCSEEPPEEISKAPVNQNLGNSRIQALLAAQRQ